MVFYLFKVVAYTPTVVTEFTTVARESRFGSLAPICCTFVNWFAIIHRQVTDNYITETQVNSGLNEQENSTETA